MDKIFIKSKTILGVILGFLPTILPVFGIHFGPDVAELINGTVDAIISAAGGIIAIYGRVTAIGQIKWNPFK